MADKNKGGRPPRNTPERVAAAVSQMIQDYEETRDIKCLHDYYLLQILGNISPKTLERYYDGTADKAINNNNNIQEGDPEVCKKQGYGDALKRLITYRAAICTQHITEDRQPTGWIFLSKQPHWGGYQDVQRVQTSGKQEITVTLTGPDGKALDG